MVSSIKRRAAADAAALSHLRGGGKAWMVVTVEEGFFVVHGHDPRTGLPARARITADGFQYVNRYFGNWGDSPVDMQLYIPASIPIPV